MAKVVRHQRYRHLACGILLYLKRQLQRYNQWPNVTQWTSKIDSCGLEHCVLAVSLCSSCMKIQISCYFVRTPFQKEQLLPKTKIATVSQLRLKRYTLPARELPRAPPLILKSTRALPRAPSQTLPTRELFRAAPLCLIHPSHLARELFRGGRQLFRG